MLHSLPARMISGKKNPQVVLHRFLDKEAKIHWKFKSTCRLKEKVYTNSWLLWKWDGLHSRRDNSDQITEQNISRICYFCHVWTKNKLKKKKSVKKCDQLLKKDEQQTDGKWKLLLPQAAWGAESIQSICRPAALCHEQQVRASHCNAQWEFSACRVKVTRTCLLMGRMHSLFMTLKSWVEVKMQLWLDFPSVWIRAP